MRLESERRARKTQADDELGLNLGLQEQEEIL